LGHYANCMILVVALYFTIVNNFGPGLLVSRFTIGFRAKVDVIAYPDEDAAKKPTFTAVPNVMGRTAVEGSEHPQTRTLPTVLRLSFYYRTGGNLWSEQKWVLGRGIQLTRWANRLIINRIFRARNDN